MLHHICRSNKRKEEIRFAPVVTIMAEQEAKPAVWVSGNIPEGKEHNQKFIERYKERIPFLDYEKCIVV